MNYLYSLLIFTIMSLWSNTYLYSIILFLTLISGLLIMFLYFMSLISNSKSSYTFNTPIIMTFSMNMTILMYFQWSSPSPHSLNIPYFNYSNINYPFYLTSMNSNTTNMPLYSLINEKMFLNITKIYLYPFNNITLLSMLFLLLSMFMIIKICSIKSSSLRKIN